jgi:hypothetical protein
VVGQENLFEHLALVLAKVDNLLVLLVVDDKSLEVGKLAVRRIFAEFGV